MVSIVKNIRDYNFKRKYYPFFLKDYLDSINFYSYILKKIY